MVLQVPVFGVVNHNIQLSSLTPVMSSEDEADNVPLAYRNIYQELFLNDDSDEEFSGFDDEELINANDQDVEDERFAEGNWFMGDVEGKDKPVYHFTGKLKSQSIQIK
jgi:hypothetical protein